MLNVHGGQVSAQLQLVFSDGGNAMPVMTVNAGMSECINSNSEIRQA